MRVSFGPATVVGVWVWVSVAALAVAAVFAVRHARLRREFDRALQERGWLLERERESAAQSAVDAERARIAHELHDIVSHNVSLMVVQAGAARQILSADVDEAQTALLAVEAAGRGTMTELRNLLGVLAPASEGDDLAPQPSLRRLSPLVDRIAFAGLPVEVRISGEPCELPSGVDLTAYRIIQEALTNALKHGDGGRAEVSVRYAEHSLRVEILSSGGNGTRPEGGHADGRGLLGLQQRVALFGGDFDARRRLGGGFRVRAKIPL
jgi:signal transduction histidine kinase